MVEPQQQQQQRRRRRPALACWECRRRKIKCDRNEPCSHCARHKTQCVFKPYRELNEHVPVIDTDPVVRPAGQLPRGQSGRGLPSASTASPSPSTPSFDSLHSATASSPLRSAGVACAQAHTESHEQLEQPPQSAASTAGMRKRSIPDHHDPRGSHPPKPRAPGAATTALKRNTSMITTHSDSIISSGVRDNSSSLPHRTSSPDSLAASDSRLSDLLQRVQRLEDSRSTVAWTGDSVDSLASKLPPGQETSWEDPLVRPAHSRHQVRPRQWQVVLNKPRDLGKNRQMGEASEFATIISCYNAILGKGSKEAPVQEPEITALNTQAGEFMLKCKSIARRLKMDRPSRCLPQVPTDPGFGFHLVPSSRVVADTMAKLYFQFFESTHRILHPPTFWTDYQRYWDHPETVTNDLRFKVLLVITIGSSLYDHGNSNAALRNMEMVRPWIYAAETWLTGPLEKDRLDIGGLQIYCLSIIARQIFSIGGDLVWMSMGSLIHRALQIGLHRDPKYLPSVSVFHSELRRRLWATILDLVVQASLDAWMPPRISFDEFDTEPPSNVNDEEINESTLKIIPHPRTTFTTTSTQLALLDSLPVRLRIVQLLNSLHSELSYPRVLAISSELNESLQKCSSLGMMKAKDSEYSHIMDNNQEVTPSTTPFHRSLLDYLVRRFIIPLHYFFSNQAQSNPMFQYSLTLSLDAALALISPEPDAGGTFSRLMATGGGMFREGLRCAITAISLELLAHVGAQQKSGTLYRAPQHRELIKGAVRDLIALSEERIRHGETNVKSHMFLSMILAQVEAVEAGLGIELAIAKRATDSLRFCHGVLSERAQTSLPIEESELVSAAEGIDGATPSSLTFENYKMDWDWDWDSFLPNISSY